MTRISPIPPMVVLRFGRLGGDGVAKALGWAVAFVASGVLPGAYAQSPGAQSPGTQSPGNPPPTAAGVSTLGLSDPTRPPGVAAGSDGDEGGGGQLQSVILSGGRKLAIIGGVAYKVGERVGEARVLSIDAEVVRLRDAQGIQVLRISPALETVNPPVRKNAVKSSKGATQ
jgi:hypothetical protein